MSDDHDHQHSVRGARTNFFTLVGQGTSFLFGAAAARLFGQAVWGSYTTAFAVVDVLVRTSLLAGDKAVLVFVPARRALQDEPGAVRAVAAGLRVAVVTSLVFAAAMVLASYAITDLSGDPLDGHAMRALAPVVVIGALTTMLLAATMAAKVLRYNFLAKGLAEPVTMLALALGVGLAWPSLHGLALAPLVAGAVALGLALWGVNRLFSLRAVLRSVRRDRTERELIAFALPLAASEFLNILALRLGSFVLIAYVVVGERAIFNTCVLLATTISFIRGAFDTVLAPIASEAWAQNDRARLAANLKSQSCMVLLFVIPLASLFIVGGAAVLALYGPGFVSGHSTLVWLALGHAVNATLGLAGWVLLAARNTRAMLINNLAKVVLELLLCVVLIPPLGIEGAALATLLGITALHALQAYEVWQLAGIHPFSVGMLRLAVLGAAIIGCELLAYVWLDGSMIVRAGVPLAVGTPLYFLVARRWREKRRSTSGVI